jgi:beta-lactamase regulating signal transducer with metallopeptidase domain
MPSFFDAIINAWWQGILLTALVWLILRDLPRVSAATRLAIWQLTLLTVLLLPFLQQLTYVEAPVKAIAIAATSSAVPQTVFDPVPPPAPARPILTIEDPDVAPSLIGTAAALAGFGLLRIAFAYLAVWWLKRKASPSQFPLPSLLTRDARILISNRIGMPMAVGFRHPAILLPQSLIQNLSQDELNQIILHEAAHLARRDDWVGLLERFVRAIFFVQPAVYFIGRQLDREREMACDDWVVSQSGQTKPYAEALARVAEFGATGRAPILATGVGRRKEIFRRMEALLDSTRNKIPAISGTLLLAAGATLLFLAIQAAPFNHLLGFTQYQSSSVIDDGKSRREFRLHGDIQFTPDDQDVLSMAPGARLVIVNNSGLSNRRLEIEANPEGKLEHHYFSNGVAMPFGTEAKRLLAKDLPTWLKNSDHGLDERLTRWVRSGGADQALFEIETVHSDGPKRRYLESLVSLQKLDASQLRRLLRLAATINSDSDKRALLLRVEAAALPLGLDSEILDVVNTMNSDGDKRDVLVAMIDGMQSSGLSKLFRTLANSHSDGDKAAVLIHATRRIAGPLPLTFFEALDSMHSDGDKRRVLMTLLEQPKLSPATVAAVERATTMIHSEEDKVSLERALSQRSQPPSR